MTVFTIETPSGQKLDIQADDEATALKGAQQWHAQQQPSGVIDSAREGIAAVPAGVAATLKAYTGAGPVGDALSSTAKYIAPPSYTPAPIISKDGFSPGNIPSWIAERAPSMATAIAATKLMPGPWWLKLLGGAAAGMGMTAGNEANTAAANRTGDPNAAPNATDLTRGGLTSAAENAVGTIGLSRFLPGAGVVANTGVKGLARAATTLAKTVGAEGVSGAGQSAVGQFGQTVGTPGGVSVDPTQVADSAIGQSLTGGVLAARRAAGAGLNAIKYSAITPDLVPAAIQYANRVQQAADGEKLTAGGFSLGGAQRTGFTAITKANAAVNSELADATKDLGSRVQLSPDVHNILDAAANGHQPSQGDYATLATAFKGDSQAENLLNLVRQSHVADIVNSTGTITHNKFVGGLSSIPTALSVHGAAKTALVAGAGAAIEGGAGHLIAYSPEVMTTLAGLSALARASDSITGARSPAGRFVSNFADGTSPVRVAPQAPTPAAPITPTAPLNPPIGGFGQPWGPTPLSTVPSVPQAPPAPMSPQARQQMTMQAMPALRALAAQAGPRATVAEATQEAPEAQAPLRMKGTVPADVLSNVRAIVQGLKTTAKTKAAELGKNDANAVMQSSPWLAQVLGGGNLLTPEAGTEIKKAISTANALKKLRSDPVADAAERASAQAATAATAQAAKLAAPPPPLPNVAKVTKDGVAVKVGTDAEDGYDIPFSPHATHPPDVAARKFLQDAQDAGVNIKHPNGFVTATARNITNIRGKAADVAATVPGISSASLAGQFEGCATAKAAIAHRDWLMKTMPQAAPALARSFSDAEIHAIWKH